MSQKWERAEFAQEDDDVDDVGDGGGNDQPAGHLQDRGERNGAACLTSGVSRMRAANKTCGVQLLNCRKPTVEEIGAGAFKKAIFRHFYKLFPLGLHHTLCSRT